MTLVLVTNNRFVGDGYAMGWPAPTAANYEIVFHRLQITRKSTPPSFQYIEPSGIYRNITIDDFTYQLQNNILPPKTRGLYNINTDTPPDIVVKQPSYVIVQIIGADDSSLAFQDNVPAMLTETDKHDLYTGLAPCYYESDGHGRVIEFQDFNPPPSGSDSYNMYLQYGPAGQPPIKWTEDPKIKNRGTRQKHHGQQLTNTSKKKRRRRKPLPTRRPSAG